MAKDLVPDGGSDASTTPESSADTTAEQIQALIAQGIQSAFDMRIPGLQSAYEKQIASLKRELDNVRRSNLSEDELEDEKRTEAEAELAKARSEVAALRAAQRYPKGYERYEQVMAASSVEEQLQILEGLSPASAPPTGQPAPAPEVQPGPAATPPIDPNNPRRETYEGEMTPEMADRIIGQFDRWPTWKG